MNASDLRECEKFEVNCYNTSVLRPWSGARRWQNAESFARPRSLNGTQRALHAKDCHFVGSGHS
eukprot:803585-Pyramimonas_sp.AAC.1